MERWNEKSLKFESLRFEVEKISFVKTYRGVSQRSMIGMKGNFSYRQPETRDPGQGALPPSPFFLSS
jgi:hypothetical protein